MPGKKSFNKKKTLKERLQVIVNFVNKSNEPVTSTATPLTKQKKSQREIMKDKLAIFSPEQLDILMEMKGHFTTKQVADTIKNIFNIYIERDYISKFWRGDIIDLPDAITNSESYQKMPTLKTTKIIEKKFTKEEIHWVSVSNLEYSLSERCRMFLEKYGKTISIGYLCKI
jgi:hypothetical protein